MRLRTMAALAITGVAGAFAVDRFQRGRLIRKERERAQFAEARLRAESAEALARSPSVRMAASPTTSISR